MTDHVSKEKRSEIMKLIRGKNTTPELAVRKLVYALGYRYRLHGKNLPGKPDLVFASRKKVIFVNGCFWHFHECKKGNPPKSKLEYWLPKLEQNRLRDFRNYESITALGWQYLVIWQCQISNTVDLTKTVVNFLDGKIDKNRSYRK